MSTPCLRALFFLFFFVSFSSATLQLYWHLLETDWRRLVYFQLCNSRFGAYKRSWNKREVVTRESYRVHLAPVTKHAVQPGSWKYPQRVHLVWSGSQFHALDRPALADNLLYHNNVLVSLQPCMNYKAAGYISPWASCLTRLIVFIWVWNFELVLIKSNK